MTTSDESASSLHMNNIHLRNQKNQTDRIIVLFTKPLCSACQQKKRELEQARTKRTYIEFKMDSLNELREKGLKGIILAATAMAQYHLQEETLPVILSIPIADATELNLRIID